MSSPNTPAAYALITGGAGFIGSNLAERLLARGQRVVLLDDLSRAGVERNVEWLRRKYGARVSLVRDDCRNPVVVRQLVASANQVFHFAAQVAVTSSLLHPSHDFEVNAFGTLNVLEALRRLEQPPPLVFTSTNKVYGALGDIGLRAAGERYEPLDAELASLGIDETRSLDFYSPYGCSKGAADQYVCDYARSFGLPAVVFRMSCVYGPRQFGSEDQGWVAHFLIRALAGQPITIYGDGKQVRDLLFVEDLLAALELARDNAARLRGRAFNIGGGVENTASLLEVLREIARLSGQKPTLGFEPPRMGDQRYYVSAIGKFASECGWRPRVSVNHGLCQLYEWLERERQNMARTEAVAEIRPSQGAF